MRIPREPSKEDESTPATGASTIYDKIRRDFSAICEGERDIIANAANCSALLFESLPDVNWAGVYVLKGNDLVLGPFQGKPACTRIPISQGVCGAAARRREMVIVPNVHEFPGHIACDAASNAEIVIPLIKHETLWGVLDLDSARFDRFSETDGAELERIGAILLAASDF